MKRILIIDNQTVHLQRLNELVKSTLPNSRVTVELTREVTEDQIRNTDLIILSGGTGRSIEKNPATFARLVRIIELYKKPTVGICLGAEAIAVYFGGKLHPMPVRRVGNIPIELTPRGAQVLPTTRERIMVYEFHKWLIELKDGSPLETLAYSKDGVEIFKHKKLPVFGLQFHPEVLRKDNAGHLLFSCILNQLQ